MLGLKIAVLDKPADPKLPGSERRKVYDTTLPGRGNGGHTYGDALTEDERLAVIEFLEHSSAISSRGVSRTLLSPGGAAVNSLGRQAQDLRHVK